jgi:hypothetical protein
MTQRYQSEEKIVIGEKYQAAQELGHTVSQSRDIPLIDFWIRGSEHPGVFRIDHGLPNIGNVVPGL